MKKIKEIICLCTAFLMISSLCSCDKAQDKTTLLSSDQSSSGIADSDRISNKPDKITTYFDRLTLEGGEEFSIISEIRYSGDKLYVLGHNNSVVNYSCSSTDLNTLQTVPAQNDNNIPDTLDPENICTDKEGNIYECLSGAINKYDKEFNLTKTIDKDFFDGYVDVKNLSFYSSAVSENGDIYIAASLNTPESIQIIKLNSSFQVQYITEKGDFSDCGLNISKIFIGKNGNPVLCTMSDITYINEISAESGRTLLRYELPFSDDVLGRYGNYDIIYKISNTIYGYNYKGENTTQLYTSDNISSYMATAYLRDDDLITQQILTEDNFSNVLGIYNKDGKLEKIIPISTNHYIRDMSITADGTVLVLSEHNEIIYTDDGYFDTLQLQILCVNEDGTTEKKYTSEKQDTSAYNIFGADGHGNMCICNTNSNDEMMHATYISAAGEQSDITYDISAEVSGILCINDEIYIVCIEYDDHHTLMLHVNKETHTIDNTSDLVIPYRSIVIAGNGENDLFYLSGGEVYGYNIADNSSEKLFSWFDTDVEYMPDNLNNFVLADDDNIFFIDAFSSNYENSPGNPISVIHLKRSDKERLKQLNDRTLITLAGMNITNNFFTMIKKFNNTNSEYMIIATDYSQYDPASDEDNSEGFRKMEEDIASGNIPDIILNNPSYDIRRFLSKDLFTDLNVFLKNDPEIDSSDLAENFLDACTYNGKLCCFPCRFTLNTFTMPQEYTDSNSVLTYDDFFTFADKFGDSPFINTSRENASISLLSSYINDNVDYADSTCCFETDVFRKLLQKLKECVPRELFISDDYTFNYNNIIDQRFLRISNMNKLFYLYYDMKDNNSDHISYNSKGIPSSSGTVSSVEISHSIGITNSCENKDGAWKFIKYYADIKDGYGIWIDNIGNPLSIYRSKNKATIDSAVSFISDEHHEFDQSDKEKLSDTLNTICNGKIICADINSGIYSIINEEAEKYYNDTQSIEETVSAVQKRAEQYLSEISSNN